MLLPPLSLPMIFIPFAPPRRVHFNRAEKSVDGCLREEKENERKAENAAKIAALELNIKELLKDKKKEKEAKRKEFSALEVCIACISTRS